MRVFPTRNEMVASLDSRLILAELGVFRGQFSDALLNTEPTWLYLVDTFDGVVECGDKDGLNIEYIDITSEYDRLCKKYADEPVTVCKMTTKEFLEDTFIEAVYIDANHSYESVYEDLVLSFNAGAKIFMCHDYNLNSVSLAVKQFCNDYKFKAIAITKDLCPTIMLR